MAFHSSGLAYNYVRYIYCSLYVVKYRIDVQILILVCDLVIILSKSGKESTLQEPNQR